MAGAATASCLSVLPWSSWREWEETYADLFALDDPRARGAGVRRVNTWRARGNLPLAVDATSALAELAVLESASPPAVSEHAISLTYAMTITRLVNGVVDSLQQSERANSVRRLAERVGLPASLVEMRHECTHNRLPTISSLRLAAEQALLWLHEHYWLPQRALLPEAASAAAAALEAYRAAAAPRCARGEAAPRAQVLACAQQLERAVHPTQLSSLLVPLLLDGGLLAPAAGLAAEEEAAADAGGGGGDDGAAAPAPGAEWGSRAPWELQRRLWSALLAKLHGAWPRHALPSAVLLGCADRLREESAAAEPPPAATTHALRVESSGARGRRLLALQAWALHLLTAPAGGGEAGASDERLGALPLDPAALQHAAWLAARASHGWGRPVTLRAMRHSGWGGGSVKGTAKRLMALQEKAEAAMVGSPAGPPPDATTPTPPPGNDLADLADLAASPSLPVPSPQPAAALAEGSPWLVCPAWCPVGLGAPLHLAALHAARAAAAAPPAEARRAAALAAADDTAPREAGEAGEVVEAEAATSLPPTSGGERPLELQLLGLPLLGAAAEPAQPEPPGRRADEPEAAAAREQPAQKASVGAAAGRKRRKK